MITGCFAAVAPPLGPGLEDAADIRRPNWLKDGMVIANHFTQLAFECTFWGSEVFPNFPETYKYNLFLSPTPRTLNKINSISHHRIPFITDKYYRRSK